MDTPVRTIANDTFITCAAVSNDIALVGCELNNAGEGVHTYNLNTGRLLQTLTGQGNTSPLSVALSPDGGLAVASTEGLKAVLWEAGTGRFFQSVAGSAAISDNASRVAFAPDSEVILSSFFGDLVVFDTALAERSRFRVHIGGGTLFAIAPSPDGNLMAAGNVRFDSGGDFIVYNLLSGQAETMTLSTNPGAGVTCLAWAGTNVFTGSGSGSIKLVDAQQSGTLVPSALPRHARPVNSLAVSPDGRRLLSGSDDATMKVIDVATGNELHSFNHAEQVKAVGFANNGTFAVSCGGRSLKVWDLTGL